MSAIATNGLLTLRFALREMRGGLRGFAVFIACIALGVAAIAGVGSFARSLGDGLAREGRVILGGDVAFALSQREASPTERAFLDNQGKVSAAATMRAMARAPSGESALVEIKAVDGAYPLFGNVALEPAGNLADALAQRDGVYGAAADPALFARLNLERGARIVVGSATIVLRATLGGEPDKLAGGIGFGPRLLVSEAALRATGLIQPGSLVRWHYRLKVPGADANDRATQAVVAASERQLPDAGWEVRTRANASPALGRNIERFTQYLTLVGLTALLVGGVGVANAVKHYLDRRREVIATLKSLGATGGRVFAIYLTEVMLLAAIGTAFGLVVGALLPFAISAAFGKVLPLPIEPALHAGELSFAVLYGFLTALAFALWPLGRAHDVPVSALYRDAVAPERRMPRVLYVALTALTITTLAVLAVVLAYDRKIAAIFIVAAAAVFATLRLVALLIMAIARRIPRPRYALLRLVLANIHRPGALTPSVVLSLGLGLALLVTLLEIDGNLRNQFVAALPDKAPSVFFVDIQDADAARFDAFAAKAAPDARYERVPMLRGRIVSASGIRAEDLKAAPNASWVLQSDRGITYAAEVPAGSRVVAGEWWKRGLSGPAAGVVREQDRRRAWSQDRRFRRHQRARPQHHGDARQFARGRVAIARHQFRAGVLARQFSWRAAYPYRDPRLSGGRNRRAGDRALKAGRDRLSDRYSRARARSARGGRQGGARPDAGDPRRERDHADRRRAGARRRARDRPSPPRL